MNVGLLLTAAGPGNRLGGDIPKGLAEIGGVPLVLRALRCFKDIDSILSTVVVAPFDRLNTFEGLISQAFPDRPMRVVSGGAERQLSVAKGLDTIDDTTELVVIHDAARPFVRGESIREVIEAAKSAGAATLATRCVDTILVDDGNAMLSATPDRSGLWACQTPQVFALEIVRAAHKRALEQGRTYTDDATLVHAAGHEVRIVASSAENMKITTPGDLAFAEFLIREGKS